MRRVFGGSGGTLRVIERAAGSGVGLVQESLSVSRPKRADSVSLSSSSVSSSSAAARPASASATVHEWRPSSFFFDEDDWESVQGGEEDDKTEIEVPDFLVFGPVPSVAEVENAVSAIQQVLVPVACPQFDEDGSPLILSTEANDQLTNSSSDEAKSDWIEPAVHLVNPGAMQPQAYDNVLDTFRLLQLNPSVQKMVISISSDEAVWNAVMNNKVVQEVRESFYAAHAAEDDESSMSSEESSMSVSFLRWLLDNTTVKVSEFINMITKLVNEIFKVQDKEKIVDNFESTLRSTLMLSVVVLLVIVVTRIRGP